MARKGERNRTSSKEDVSVIGRRIRELRLARGWSRAELAERAGISRAYVWDLENEARVPGAKLLSNLAEAFGVQVPYLLGQTDDPYGEPDLPPDIRQIWETLKQRPDLQLLVSTARPLSREQVQMICSLIAEIRKPTNDQDPSKDRPEE